MKITLYISEHCRICQRVIKSIIALKENNSSLITEIKDVSENPFEFQIIVPSLFIDNELVMIGEFNSEKLHSLIEIRKILSE